MHLSSLHKMKAFKEKYLNDLIGKEIKVLDLGSQDVNGSYKPIFDIPGWQYIGVDASPGKNVDVILTSPYHWSQFARSSIDVIISGQAFEHIDFFWLTALEMRRVLKDDGICCIIAPSSGPEHRYPVDCWRFYPDGLKALANFAGLNPLEVYTQWDDVEDYTDGSNAWHDSVLIAKKSQLSFRRELKLHLTSLLFNR
ncbi:sam-dependent methyltransferase [Leptolyngbya sp. Heron Island J]|uniref:methyltransferase domain-containing protein n=1 Tax=Leptolyngbya sp. Heron Island J TaxID=1385935 RepID=UPI0003B9CA08|nr:class I SAM-dependent methyltransferase [Leptolyngbya sp. Heron Island J]ESA33023.1 sam-dependent methyltransferase [Leptolyngbya sp. Heron Island J]